MADKTPDQLTTVTSINSTDLAVVYPTGGPLSSIAWVNVVVQLVTDLTPTFLKRTNNLSDLNSATTARTNLGLGSVATLNTGTSSGNVAVLGSGGKTPISTLPGGYLPKSGTYTATLADCGKLIDCTSTFTLTLPDASTVGETYFVDVRNAGTGVITLAPVAGTIDGAASITIGAGVTRTAVTDGTNYFTTPEGPQGWTLIQTQSFASGTTKTYSDIPQGYSELLFIANGISGTTANQIEITVSTNGVDYVASYLPAGAPTNPIYGLAHFPYYTSGVGSMNAYFGDPTSAPSWVAPTSSDRDRVYRMSGGVKYLKVFSGSGNSFNGGSGSLYAK